MKRAYVFPGQGAQYVGMGRDMYTSNKRAKELYERANDILGFRITDVMFYGTEEELKQTEVTQPSIFLHSVISAQLMSDATPDMVAGHSLGEYSALVICKGLSFEDGLLLVQKRAIAMQHACEVAESTMAAILGLPDDVVNEICQSITSQTVVIANYNCPGQVVISGTKRGVELACEKLNAVGAKQTIILHVGGAFHSPLMQPATDDLKDAILQTTFHTPQCPIYQNVNAYPQQTADAIKQNLLAQLTSPVRWTQTVKNMILDGATDFYEYGPGNVLSNLIHRIDKKVKVAPFE